MPTETYTEVLTRGARHFYEGNYETALSIFESVLEQEPTHANALNDAALAAAQLRRRNQALTYLQRALEAQPDHADAFLNVLELLEAVGDTRKAASIFNKYGPNIPESPEKNRYRKNLLGRSIDPDADSSPPICIGGCGSSGTTLLRRILDAHSEIACGKEMSVFDRPRMYDLTLPQLREIYVKENFDALDEGVPFPIQTPIGSYCGLKPGNHGDYYHTRQEVIALLHEAKSVADFWNKYFLTYAQKRGKNRWAEKTPNNIFTATKFLETYPKGRFIHMIRDGRDVCLSLIQRRGYNPYMASQRWIMCMEAGRQIADHERVYELRYESLVTEPEATLMQLFEWLSIPYEARVLDFAHTQREDSVHGYAEQPIFQSSVSRWREEWDQLSSTAAAALTLSLRQHLAVAGYHDTDSIPNGDGYTTSQPVAP